MTNKRSKNKSSANKRARTSYKQFMSPLYGPGARMQAAPIGVSSDIRQETSFYGTKGGLGMRTMAAIFEINSDTPTATGAALVDASNVYNSAQLNLTSPAGLLTGGTKTNVNFTSPVFDLIASAFVRYRIKGLKFHYRPQSSATNDARLVFAFANDPVHPLLWSNPVPNSSDLLALSDSVPFMPWEPWTLDVSDRICKDPLYTYTDPSTTLAEFSERFSDFGVISCRTSNFSGTTKLCGVLYMEADIELMEFCPISVVRPTSLLLLEKKAKQHREAHGTSGTSRGKVLPEPEKSVTEKQCAAQEVPAVSAIAGGTGSNPCDCDR